MIGAGARTAGGAAAATALDLNHAGGITRAAARAEGSARIGGNLSTNAGGTGVLGGKIHYVGGEAGRMEAFTEMQIFEPARGQWNLGPPLNRARHGTNCCVHDGKLWIAAGSGARGGEPELTSIEVIASEE